MRIKTELVRKKHGWQKNFSFKNHLFFNCLTIIGQKERLHGLTVDTGHLLDRLDRDTQSRPKRPKVKKKYYLGLGRGYIFFY